MVKENYHHPGQQLREMFDRSLDKNKINIDAYPDEPVNYVGLAESLINLWCYGYLPRIEIFNQAKEAVQKALSIDKNFGKANTVNGIIKLCEWNWTEAEKYFRLGVKLNKDDSEAHHWLALFLSTMGRFDEAIKISKHSYALRKTVDAKVSLGSIYYFAHEFEAQEKLLEPEATNDCTNSALFDWLGMAYIQQNKFDKSIAVYKRAVELSDRNSEIMGGIGHAYGIAGRDEEAKEVLQEMLGHLENCYVPPVQIAFVYAGLGDFENTMKMLYRALDEKSWELAFFNVEPWMDDYRKEPEFIKFLKNMNFPK